jgi:uncharacterized protein (DUF1015 family)
MADVQPLRALHYSLAARSLGDLVAPPYDVIDAAQREALMARSPVNVVAVDLPEGDSDPYATARDLFDAWQMQGILVRDTQPALWVHTQHYTGPEGSTFTRRGFFCRVRIEDYGPGRVRPHERTHAGPKEDRLRLTRATKTNLSPIFSLYSDPTNAAWGALESFTSQPPWGEVTDDEGTVHRLWRVDDPDAIASVQAVTRDAELLIADGHHRYETARTYAEEVGGEGEHQYVLMCLVALEDPGLTVFPTHRLVKGLDRDRQETLGRMLRRDFEITEVPLEEIAPTGSGGPLQLGYIDSHHQRAYRLTFKDQALATQALADRSEAYQHLDTGVLEALILKGTLELTDDDISHLRNFGYARDAEQAVSMVQAGEFDAAFLMRPTPIEQVRDIAAAGENMPPKSTYFFPKLLTGLLFSPLF